MERFLAQSTVATRARVTNARRRGWLRLVLVGILCLIGIGYISPAYSFYTRSEEIDGAREVNESLQATHDSLSTEKERLMEGVYVEEVARRDLGLVKPGEQPFIVKDIEQEITRNAAADETASQPAPTRDDAALQAAFPFQP